MMLTNNNAVFFIFNFSVIVKSYNAVLRCIE